MEKKLVVTHSLAVTVTGLLGLVFILLSAILPKEWVVLATFLNNVGTTSLAVALLEFVYKTLLQENLVGALVAHFKRVVSLPVKAIYLRRQEIPSDQALPAILEQAQDNVYLKAISFNITHTGGLLSFVDRALQKHPNLKVHFLVFNPASPNIDFVTTVSALKMPALKHSIEAFAVEVRALGSKHDERVRIAYYNTIPTSGILLVDLDLPQAWARIEPYLYQGQPPDERLNIIIERRQDPDYFDQLRRAVCDDWQRGQMPPLVPNNSIEPTA